MGKAYPIFTINSGSVRKGAVVSTLALKGANIEIPAILVGETGRGRNRGVLPVHLPSALYAEWKEKGTVTVEAAEIGATKKGAPKLFAKEKTDCEEKAICVFPTKIGFRGSNSHTGDRTGETKKDSWGDEVIEFLPFPGDVLTEGSIAQGTAGRAGGGTQMIAVLSKDAVFRTGYSGRLYGAPRAHYYTYTGEGEVLAMTWEERSLADVF
ncbi:MAG: hypothetical protein H8D63_00940 [Parcubacteria group bacterium]|nr:hypothetical protein [Parcubacteria group bacterium]